MVDPTMVEECAECGEDKRVNQMGQSSHQCDFKRDSSDVADLLVEILYEEPEYYEMVGTRITLGIHENVLEDIEFVFGEDYTSEHTGYTRFHEGSFNEYVRVGLGFSSGASIRADSGWRGYAAYERIEELEGDGRTTRADYLITDIEVETGVLLDV